MIERAGKILSVILALLLVVFMAFSYFKDNELQKAKDKAFAEYEKRTAEMRSERSDLMSELVHLQKDVIYYGESTQIAVCFAVSDKSDISYIRETAEKHRFTPVLVLDCTTEPSVMESILETADAEWEIMLSAPSLSADIVEALASSKVKLEGMGKNVCNAVFARIRGMAQNEIDTLQNAGFEGCTVYNESPVSGQTESGFVYFDFSRISSGDVSIEARLSSCCAKRASMLYVFDMESIRNGSIREEKLVLFMDTLVRYSKEGECSFASVAEILGELSKINGIKEDIKTSRAEQIVTIQDRIEELDILISQIYAECFAGII